MRPKSSAPKPSRRFDMSDQRPISFERPSQGLRKRPKSYALPIESKRKRKLIQPVYDSFSAVAELGRTNDR